MDLFGFFIDAETLSIFAHLLVAAVLGGILGLERERAHKTAGLRTYALVSMGSALFVAVSVIISSQFVGVTNFDPLRVAAQIVTGIGFLGAGVIIFRGSHVEGITTAAGLWVAAGIGMASGFGLYAIATFATIVTLFIFTILWFFETRIKKVSGKWSNGEI
ncbi:MAG: MgtC/SapB family protein [Parcubacteria group bacterium]|nr:MgtC/SapB family protein [Parcubacteria group bacterium]